MFKPELRGQASTGYTLLRIGHSLDPKGRPGLFTTDQLLNERGIRECNAWGKPNHGLLRSLVIPTSHRSITSKLSYSFFIKV